MNNQSNLYAEKLVSEHPLAYWMLNETVDYLPLLLESERNISNSSNWTITNGSAYNETSSLDTTPFPESYTTRIERAYPFAGTIVEIDSKVDILNTKINFDLGNICVSGYAYISTPNIDSITWGYTYYDPTLGLTLTESTTRQIYNYEHLSWVFFSYTFDLPSNNAQDINFYFNFEANGSTGTSGSDYSILLNGINIAQWSELFNSYSLGVYPYSIPTDINLPSTLKVIPAKQYGSSSQDAYYIASDTKIYSKNFSIPLVYGSSNCTDLYPLAISNETYPSLIIPGYGFLNKKGKYLEYTVEMWVRINSDSVQPYKIFGPIASNDGLYVESGFLTLVIGNKFQPYYVGEWFRPMLLHIRYINGNISVLMNGEEVITITLNEEDLNFPEEFVTVGGIPKSQDWLGFYAYENVHPFTIDNVSIFSYSVPKEVAKRRWVWGQAVVPIGTTNASLNARTVTNDYTYSKYAVNHSYPDFAKWKQGFSDNLDTASNSLKLPNYELPVINLENRSLSRWYKDLQVLENSSNVKYFKFSPNESWDQQSSYFYFNSLGFLNGGVDSFYGIFESDGLSENEILFKVINKISTDSFTIDINETTVTYRISLNGISSILKTETITPNEKFVVGINIPKISLLNYSNISKFFEGLNLLSMYVAGDDSKYFNGKIYKVGFDSEYNNRKISELYNSSGFFQINSAATLINHTANYTLVPILKFGLFFADIAVAAYWQDYMPLSYFAKYVKNNLNELVYDLDFIQFNIDYPEPIETFEVSTTEAITYSQLDDQFSEPFQKTYNYLDNASYTGWNSYNDLELSSVTTYFYDTENSIVRSYISFQNILDGANKTLIDFDNSVDILSSAVVDPNSVLENWEDSVFEVVDGSVIYPPLKNISNRSVNFNNLALVYHIDFNVNGIYHNRLALKRLQLASQVLNAVDFTPLGTKYGIDIYPYSKLGLYYDFKRKNPISTYKGSTPYLYLTRHSGWRLRGKFDLDLDRGISIPINKEQANGIQVNSIQVWCKYTEKEFTLGETKFMSLFSKGSTYDFYFSSDVTKERAKIYAKNRQTGLIQDQFEYYVNGKLCSDPYIIREEWSSISIAFGELLDFSNFTGRLNINGPLIYNNVSYYLSSNLEQEQRVQRRTWFELKDGHDWTYWQSPVPPEDFTWENVKIISVSQFAFVDPSVGYSQYIGSDRIIIDDNFEGLLINTKKSIGGSLYDDIKVYGTTEWSTSTRIAV